jgi:hypothetical protein
LAVWSTSATLDNEPPQNAKIVDFKDKLPKGTPSVVVRATVTPPVSGIKDVEFILGPKTAFDDAAAAKNIVKGKSKASDDSIWEGVLPIPQDRTGKLEVAVRFTSNANLIALDSKEGTIEEPAPLPVAAAAPVLQNGAIKGKVTENDIAQRDLTVYLYDPKAKDKENLFIKNTTTKSDGTYEFLDVPPGEYRVVCTRSESLRKDDKPVTVPSGKTVMRDLDLVR